MRLLEYTSVIFLVAAIGSILPFIRKWNTERLHNFVAFGAGVFLGAVFFHLLPDVKGTKGAFTFLPVSFLCSCSSNSAPNGTTTADQTARTSTMLLAWRLSSVWSSTV